MDVKPSNYYQSMIDLVILAFIKGVFWTGIVQLIFTFITFKEDDNGKPRRGSGAWLMVFVGAVCAFIKAKKLGII